MQGDVSSPRTGEDYGYSGAGTEGMVEEKQPLDYLFDTYDATANGVSRAVSFLADRPLVAGSIVLGVLGAIAGARLAEFQARRRRRGLYQKAANTFTSSSGMVADWFSRKPKETADVLKERSRGLMSSMGDGKDITKRLPKMSRPKVSSDQGLGKQIGYMVGLIPPIIALVRNPLVRDMGVRMLSRRFTGQRK